jgi:hypothetical protein
MAWEFLAGNQNIEQKHIHDAHYFIATRRQRT